MGWVKCMHLPVSAV